MGHCSCEAATLNTAALVLSPQEHLRGKQKAKLNNNLLQYQL